jgi:heme/copper-type cytochrome/quinol oxidase subunit 1
MTDTRFASPVKAFAIVGVSLLLLSGLTWHSDWPPLNWKRTHFANGEFGHEILMVSVLFVVMAFVYFIAPKILGRVMNKKLGQVHFWASLIWLFPFGCGSGCA